MATKKQSRINTRVAAAPQYFTQPGAPEQELLAPAPEVPAQPAAAYGGGGSQRSSEGNSGTPTASPNITPGLPSLSADAATPGAGLSTTYSAEDTTAGLRGGADTLDKIATVGIPLSIAMRDRSLYGAAGMAKTLSKGLGIAADINNEDYGKAMVGAASFMPGPIGMAAGLGRMGYDAYQGYKTGSSTGGGMSNMGANYGTGEFDTGRVMQNAVFGSGGPFGTTLADVPAANPMQRDPATRGEQEYRATSSPVYSPRVSEPTSLGPIGGGGKPGESAMGGSGGYSGYDFADGGLIDQPVGLSMSGYADGGEVSNGPLLAMGFAGGGRVAGMGNPGGDMTPQMIEMKVNQMARNPQFQQGVMQAIQPLMQSGELTPQEVTVMSQIAMASMQNPKLYPQLRQFVAQQGMAPLPPAYDPTVIMKILAVTRALEQSGGGMAAPRQGQPTPAGQVPPTSQAQMQNPTGAPDGGFLQGPGTGRSDSIGTQNLSNGSPVKVSNGEYVIPEHVVRAKGRDHFDALLRRYSEVPKSEA
jgi:hypothetical protein